MREGERVMIHLLSIQCFKVEIRKPPITPCGVVYFKCLAGAHGEGGGGGGGGGG